MVVRHLSAPVMDVIRRPLLPVALGLVAGLEAAMSRLLACQTVPSR